MASRTPGRARRGEEKHLPYNADPKTVGTRSNAVMPTNVARLHDGFEDPAAFFQTPGTDIGSRTFSSTFARTPKTPGARSDYTAATPMTGDAIGTMRKSSGRRLSEYAHASDDEAEQELGGVLADDDLLRDDDELHPATPKYYDQGMSLPARSRVSVSSPGFNRTFDSIPSPRASNSAARSSPRKSTLSRISPSKSMRSRRISDLTVGDTEQDTSEDFDGGFDDDLGSSPSRNTTTRQSGRLSSSPVNQKNRSPAQKKAAGATRRSTITDLEEDITVERDISFGDDFQEESTRQSNNIGSTSRVSNVTRGGRENSVSDNEGPSYDNDGATEGSDQTTQDVSFGNDDTDIQDNSGEVSALVDDMAGGDDDDDDDGLEDVEEEDEEERSGDETERPTQPKKDVAKAKKAPPRRQRRDAGAVVRSRAREGSAKPQRTRISQIGVGEPADEDEDGYHGTFKTRRSLRTHYPPLEFWRNEHVEYARGPGLPVIKAIVRMEEEEARPLSKVGRARSVAPSRQRSASETKRKRYQDEPADEEGWDANTDTTGLVKDYPSGVEAQRIIAYTKAMVSPKAQKSKDESQVFRYQKIFGEGNFMAAGVVHIGVGKSKAPKPSKDNAYVFYVIQGAVQVQIYRTSFVMAPGGQFLVPRGNDYSIENISPDKEAQLFFAQARKIRADEEETEDSHSILINGNRSLSMPAPSGNGAGKSTGQAKKKKKLAKKVRGGSSPSESGSGDADDY